MAPPEAEILHVDTFRQYDRAVSAARRHATVTMSTPGTPAEAR